MASNEAELRDLITNEAVILKVAEAQLAAAMASVQDAGRIFGEFVEHLNKEHDDKSHRV